VATRRAGEGGQALSRRQTGRERERQALEGRQHAGKEACLCRRQDLAHAAEGGDAVGVCLLTRCPWGLWQGSFSGGDWRMMEMYCFELRSTGILIFTKVKGH